MAFNFFPWDPPFRVDVDWERRFYFRDYTELLLQTKTYTDFGDYHPRNYPKTNLNTRGTLTNTDSKQEVYPNTAPCVSTTTWVNGKGIGIVATSTRVKFI